jgi:hypothetical protein
MMSRNTDRVTGTGALIETGAEGMITASDFADRRQSAAGQDASRPQATRHHEERRRPAWQGIDRPWWLQVDYVTREVILRHDGTDRSHEGRAVADKPSSMSHLTHAPRPQTS